MSLSNLAARDCCLYIISRYIRILFKKYTFIRVHTTLCNTMLANYYTMVQINELEEATY